ncbi:MAG: General secretion pathway protein K [candidate division BRC1 bacterium ADurb.BinA364]|nr:MAG: General secretion pathway protein K [candidate division BRC1 bacterium ADurb.BinA364]
MKLTTLRRDSLIARELARIGLARAVVDLKNDLIMDYRPDEENPMGQPFDGPADLWRQFESKEDIEISKDRRYSAAVVEEESKLCLNRLGPNQLEVLKMAIRQLGTRESEAENIAQAIYDWMDPDTRPVGGEGEDEVAYYSEQLARRQKIRWNEDMALVRPKNDYYTTLEELLLVPGMTPELYYGFDPADEKAALEREKDLADGKPAAKGLRDLFTVDSQEFLNLNGAGVEAMTALFGAMLRDEKEGRKVAEDVFQARGEGRSSSRSLDNDKAFKTIEDAQRAMGPSGPLLVASSQAYLPLKVTASRFSIRATGQILDSRGDPRVTRELGAIVERKLPSFMIRDDIEDRRQRRGDMSRFEQRMEELKDDWKANKNTGVYQVPIVRALRWFEY